MKQPLLVLAFAFLSLSLRAQNAPQPDLSVFPNPAAEFISVQDNSDAVGQVAVFNFLGKKIKTFQASKGEHYYVGDLVKGVYFVQLIDRQKQIIKTQKIERR